MHQRQIAALAAALTVLILVGCGARSTHKAVEGGRLGPVILVSGPLVGAPREVVESYAGDAPIMDANGLIAGSIKSAGAVILSDRSSTTEAAPLIEAWRGGLMLVGVGSGAETLGLHMPAEATSQEMLAAAEVEDLAPGIGVFPRSVIVHDVLQGDRLASLLDAMARDGGAGYGLGLTRGAMVRIDLERGWLQVLEGGPVIVLEKQDASMNAKKRTHEGLRFHWLEPGDQFGWDSGLMQFVANKVRMEGGPARADATLPDAFAPDALPTLVRRLASTERGRAFTARAGTHTLTLSSDDRTVAFRSLDPEGAVDTLTDTELMEQRTYSLWSAVLSLAPAESP